MQVAVSCGIATPPLRNLCCARPGERPSVERSSSGAVELQQALTFTSSSMRMVESGRAFGRDAEGGGGRWAGAEG